MLDSVFSDLATGASLSEILLRILVSLALGFGMKGCRGSVAGSLPVPK